MAGSMSIEEVYGTPVRGGRLADVTPASRPACHRRHAPATSRALRRLGGTMSTTALTTARRRTPAITRIVSMLGAVLLASAILVVGSASAPAVAAPFDQCNNAFSGGDQGANCQITVENALDLGTGSASSRVSTLVCNGGANTVTTCTGTPIVQTFDYVVELVDQCNDADNGGGSTLHCSVVVINTIVGSGTTGAPSINQCNNSFDSLPLPGGSSCLPGGATTDAAVTQCNDSMNGGTQVSMNCTVGESTISAAMPIRVNQCNNSINGGGSLLVCSTSITTTFVPAAAAPAPAPDELARTGAVETGALVVVPLAALLLGALLVGVSIARRRTVPSLI